MAETLEPCPWCSGDDIRHRAEPWGHWFECGATPSSCGTGPVADWPAGAPWEAVRAEAARLWNTRKQKEQPK